MSPEGEPGCNPLRTEACHVVDRSTEQLSRCRRLVAPGGRAVVRPASHARHGLRPPCQPAPRFQRRIRRVPQVRAGRRPAAARLARLRTVRSLLRQRVRGRHELALLFRARHQRFDGLWFHGRDEVRLRPPHRGHARLFGQPAGRRGGFGLRGQENRAAVAAAAQRCPPAAGARHVGRRPTAKRNAARAASCTNWPRRSASGRW